MSGATYNVSCPYEDCGHEAEYTYDPQSDPAAAHDWWTHLKSVHGRTPVHAINVTSDLLNNARPTSVDVS